MPCFLRITAASLLLTAALLPAGTARGETAPDSLVVDLPDIVVSGESGAPLAADRTRLDPVAIGLRDPASLADLGVVLPSSRVAVNSRGDAHVMVRGAPERHVQTYLDGIPLNLPWDERVDLETIPAVGVGTVEGRRGPATLLDGPGALAGSVRLLPPTPAVDPHTRVGALAGGDGRVQAEARHQRRLGDWNFMGAGAWRRRDGWPMPGSDDRRANSDLEQTSLLLRGARAVQGTGRLSLLASGWTGSKGVPAELHLPPADARQWRYPVKERLLLGAALDLPLDAAGKWDLGAAASVDLFHQEIDPRGPGVWGTALQPGQDYEKNWDRTAYTRLRATRWLGSSASLAVQGSARYTNHRETVEVGAPVLTYSQWLASVAAESEVLVAERWTLRGGLGWDHASTPETGDKPANSALGRGAANLRLMHELDKGRTVYGGLSRRSRFPSLREAYSGALGRFVPNPDLGPERQDQFELGAIVTGDFWRTEIAAFEGRLHDGIEKVALQTTPDDGRFMRVNRSRITTSGWEFLGTVRLANHLVIDGQHTVLSATVDTPSGVLLRAEDRPQYLSLAAVRWDPPLGAGAACEARVTGPRWSADTTAPDGLTRLPAGVTWHLRLTWRWAAGPEMYVRADNLFDQRVDDQVGLPAPGRRLAGGASLTF